MFLSLKSIFYLRSLLKIQSFNFFQSVAAVNDQNNVRVEAQPVDTHSNMSPETLTAISGSSSPQPPTSSATASDHDQKNMMQNLFQDGKH